MEMILIISSMVVGLVILLAGMFSGKEGTASGLESPDVTAQDSAMPGQGWAPLMVYYCL
jgi:hypothetical protein